MKRVLGHNLKFQIRMFLIYAILGILISIIAGGLYFYVNVVNFRQREYQELNMMARQSLYQYSDLLRTVEDTGRYLLSDQEVLSSITTLTQKGRTNLDGQEVRERKNTIRVQMNTDYLLRKFYRILYFNEYGDVVSTADYGEKAVSKKYKPEDFEWYDKSVDNTGELIIRPLHKDEWGDRTSPKVFSAIKKIQGKSMGFFEVQIAQANMDELFEIPGDAVTLCIMNGKGDILYHLGDIGNPDFYTQFCGKSVIQTGEYSFQNETRLTSVFYDRQDDAYIIVSENKNDVYGKLVNIYFSAILLTGGFMLLSLCYILFASRRLTRPVLQLQKMIQSTSWETLDAPIKLPDSSDEFQRLGEAYIGMRERLKQAMIKETQMSTLQLQAQFDLLQAQVNPHFIYNVLNIISAHGMMHNDEKICDMCDDLAGMLRYATNTKERYATISEEMEYLNKYFDLLQCRYEQKFEYEVQIDEEIQKEIVPKILLQQLVENSISHGFKNVTGIVMKIMVDGWADKGKWYIRVRDNGEGFSEESIKMLKGKTIMIREALGRDRTSLEMEIGGMGLANLYARLYLIEREHIIFFVKNWADGAETIIGGSVSDKYGQ